MDVRYFSAMSGTGPCNTRHLASIRLLHIQDPMYIRMHRCTVGVFVHAGMHEDACMGTGARYDLLRLEAAH